MKKVILSAVMSFALLSSGVVMAQDKKDAKPATEKTSSKEKKGDKSTRTPKEGDKKSTCSKDKPAEGTKAKPSCCE